MAQITYSYGFKPEITKKITKAANTAAYLPADVKILPTGKRARKAVITVEGQAMRFTLYKGAEDAVTATTALGHYMPVHTGVVLESPAEIENFNWINAVNGENSTIMVTAGA